MGHTIFKKILHFLKKFFKKTNWGYCINTRCKAYMLKPNC